MKLERASAVPDLGDFEPRIDVHLHAERIS